MTFSLFHQTDSYGTSAAVSAAPDPTLGPPPTAPPHMIPLQHSYYSTANTSSSTTPIPASAPLPLPLPTSTGAEAGMVQAAFVNNMHAGQWGAWPNSSQAKASGSGASAQGPGMMSTSPSTSTSMMPGQPNAASNGMLSYGYVNDGGNPEKLDVFDTYNAPGITLETGDRFSQLLEAKLNLMNQAQAQASYLPSQPHSQPLLGPYRDSLYGTFPMRSDDNQSAFAQHPLNAIRSFPQANPKAQGHDVYLPHHQQQPPPLLPPQQEQQHSTYSAAPGQNVSVIPGLQPSSWTWQSIKNYGESEQTPASCQAITQRSPNRMQQQDSEERQMSMIDPSVVDAHLRDWSQTQIQPDLVAPLPIEIASRPSSRSSAFSNSNINYQPIQAGMSYPMMPYNGLLPRMPVAYQTSNLAYTTSPASAPPLPTQPLSYNTTPLQAEPYTSRQVPSQQHPYQQAPIQHSYLPHQQVVQQSSLMPPGTTSQSLSSSRTHSTENSPAISTRSHSTGNPHGRPPNRPAALPLQSREHSSVSPSISVNLPSQSRSEPLPPLLKIRVHPRSMDSEANLSNAPNQHVPTYPAQSWPLPDTQNVPQQTRQNLWQTASEIPIAGMWQANVPSINPSREQSIAPAPLMEVAAASQPAQRPPLSKKFSLSTSAKGSTFKSSSTAKIDGESSRKRKKKANGFADVQGQKEDEAGPDARREHASEVKSPQKKKGKVSAEKTVEPILPEPISVALTQEDKDKKQMVKITIACNMCRAKKLKCNGERPRCYHCVRRGEDCCSYEAILRRRGPGKQNKKKSGLSDDEDGVGAGKRKSGGSGGRRKRVKGDAAHGHEHEGSGSASASTSTSDEEDDDHHEDEGKRPHLDLHSHAQSQLQSHMPTTSTSQTNSRAGTNPNTKPEDRERERERARLAATRIGPEDLKGISSYLLDQNQRNGGSPHATANVGGGTSGMGMGFTGWGNATASGSRFELSTARD